MPFAEIGLDIVQTHLHILLLRPYMHQGHIEYDKYIRNKTIKIVSSKAEKGFTSSPVDGCLIYGSASDR